MDLRGLGLNRYFHGIIRVNETGKDIWKGITGGCSKEEIAQEITNRYDGVNLSEARRAVESFVKELVDAGIVEDT